MIRGFIYDKKTGALSEERELDVIVREFKDPEHNIWIDIENPSEDEYKLLEEQFKFHPLATEDIKKGGQRSKIEDYGNYAFIVLLLPSDKNHGRTVQLNVFIGNNFLVTVISEAMVAQQTILYRYTKNPQNLLKGADFVLYTIVDSLVDGMFPRLTELNDKLDELEDRIFEEQESGVLKDLFYLKKEIVRFRRLVGPLRDVLLVLSRRDYAFVSEKNIAYFRDVYDHLIRLSESIDSSRDIMTGAMEAYLSTISNKLNNAMKKLTAITAIIMVPGLIAGIYGMNFQAIPELQWEHGYYFSLVLMALSVITILAVFKFKKWI